MAQRKRWRQRGAMAVAMAGAMALTACAFNMEEIRPDQAPSRLEAGRALAQTHCASCHAIGRTGAGPNPEAPPFRTLSQRYPISDLEEALAEGILVGHPAMPEFTFMPAQIGTLLTYLNAVQDEPPPARR